MIQQISLKKGNKANLPSNAPVGEPLFCLDTGELFVGMGEGAKPKPVTNTEITGHLAELNSQLDTNTNELRNLRIFIDDFKIETNTDDDAIDLAIVEANNVISSIDYLSGFTNVPTLMFSNRRYEIQRTHVLNNSISINGHGVGTTFDIQEDIEYVFSYMLDSTSVTKNEEGLLEGASINNIRFLNNRSKNIDSCLYFHNCDHFDICNIWFYGIKGSCLKFKTIRESFIYNIFTRFCGNIDKSVIYFEKNNVNNDNNNLNYMNNLNLIFSYGPSIELVSSQITNSSNICIHGIFPDVYNKLPKYFPLDLEKYNTEGFPQIKLSDHSSLGLSFSSLSWTPDKNACFDLRNSNLELTNILSCGAHYSRNEGAPGYENSSIFNLNENSVVFLTQTRETIQNSTGQGKIITGDGTGKILGNIVSRQSPIKIGDGEIEKKITANKIITASDRDTSMHILPDGLNSGQFTGGGFLYWQFKGYDSKEILNIGLDSSKENSYVGIPNNAFFKMPVRSWHDNMSNGTIYIDENTGVIRYKCLNINHAVQRIINGNTMSRPENQPIGTLYFDTEKGKPIWHKGNNVWVDSTGTIV